MQEWYPLYTLYKCGTVYMLLHSGGGAHTPIRHMIMAEKLGL